MNKSPQIEPGTRERLLEAAAEVYVEHGYRNARVRDICDRAGANIAAINYHFGDKQGLYDEVLRFAFFGITGADPTGWELGSTATPTEQLRAFVTTFLSQLLSEGRSALYMKLVTREMTDPTPALGRVIEEGIRPQIESLLSTIRALVGEGTSEQVVRRCVGSIFGQCLYYHYGRPVITQTGLEASLDATVVEELARHITEFSLAGLHRIGKDGPAS